jgi:16S rRNA (adenine1518-N6/adenine1519-N6)-dimethyltransferase
MLYHSLLSSSKLKNILNQHQIKPKKSLGQNFLIDRNIVDKIIKAADLSKDNLVIEVGAGLGVLTVPIAKRSAGIIAYEIDKRLVPILEQTVSKCDNVEIRQHDVLSKIKNQKSNVKNTNQMSKILKERKYSSIDYKLQATSYKLIGNFPYYISSRILRYFLSAENKPESIVAVMQREVAERICAQPPNMSLLSVGVQFYGEPQIIAKISKNSFWPVPNVDSALVRIDTAGREPGSPRPAVEKQFFTFVKAGFANKRKILINNLCQRLGLDKKQWERIFRQVGLKSTVRAQELSVGEWKVLNSKIKMQNAKCNSKCQMFLSASPKGLGSFEF